MKSSTKKGPVYKHRAWGLKRNGVEDNAVEVMLIVSYTNFCFFLVSDHTVDGYEDETYQWHDVTEVYIEAVDEFTLEWNENSTTDDSHDDTGTTELSVVVVETCETETVNSRETK